ncbi:hypothetical protein Scep_006837 [Stephania cephalantha]|uniref:Uncharacterized protein n=1 Tax=Stephania cephalantha TaxID=152367 RepID=A0AAP0KBF9_9MAGN
MKEDINGKRGNNSKVFANNLCLDRIFESLLTESIVQYLAIDKSVIWPILPQQCVVYTPPYAIQLLIVWPFTFSSYSQFPFTSTRI